MKVKSKVPDSVANKRKQQKQQKSIKKGKVTKKGGGGKKTGQAQVTAKFNKAIQKKINANIVSELASVAQRVEEGKSFYALGTELGGNKKK